MGPGGELVRARSVVGQGPREPGIGVDDDIVVVRVLVQYLRGQLVEHGQHPLLVTAEGGGHHRTVVGVGHVVGPAAHQRGVVEVPQEARTMRGRVTEAAQPGTQASEQPAELDLEKRKTEDFAACER